MPERDARSNRRINLKSGLAVVAALGLAASVGSGILMPTSVAAQTTAERTLEHRQGERDNPSKPEIWQPSSRRLTLKIIYGHDPNENYRKMVFQAIAEGFIPQPLSSLATTLAGDPRSTLWEQRNLFMMLDDSYRTHPKYARDLMKGIIQMYPHFTPEMTLAIITKFEDPLVDFAQVSALAHAYPDTDNRKYALLGELADELNQNTPQNGTINYLPHSVNHGHYTNLSSDAIFGELLVSAQRTSGVFQRAGTVQNVFGSVYPNGEHPPLVHKHMATFEEEGKRIYGNPNHIELGFSTIEKDSVGYEERHQIPRIWAS